MLTRTYPIARVFTLFAVGDGGFFVVGAAGERLQTALRQPPVRSGSAVLARADIAACGEIGHSPSALFLVGRYMSWDIQTGCARLK